VRECAPYPGRIPQCVFRRASHVREIKRASGSRCKIDRRGRWCVRKFARTYCEHAAPAVIKAVITPRRNEEERERAREGGRA